MKRGHILWFFHSAILLPFSAIRLPFSAKAGAIVDCSILLNSPFVAQNKSNSSMPEKYSPKSRWVYSTAFYPYIRVGISSFRDVNLEQKILIKPGGKLHLFIFFIWRGCCPVCNGRTRGMTWSTMLCWNGETPTLRSYSETLRQRNGFPREKIIWNGIFAKTAKRLKELRCGICEETVVVWRRKTMMKRECAMWQFVQQFDNLSQRSESVARLFSWSFTQSYSLLASFSWLSKTLDGIMLW